MIEKYVEIGASKLNIFALSLDQTLYKPRGQAILMSLIFCAFESICEERTAQRSIQAIGSPNDELGSLQFSTLLFRPSPKKQRRAKKALWSR